MFDKNDIFHFYEMHFIFSQINFYTPKLHAFLIFIFLFQISVFNVLGLKYQNIISTFVTAG